ncbi:MAG: substrate-binding domain-containing protein [Lachnospiraceae bacterium]|nr:substrate-binding domain-containing protein [Lachnospiraceae bacterium]
MRKFFGTALVAALSVACLAGCGSNQAAEGNSAAGDSSAAISVLSREDGSGTRGAFIELFGIEEKDENGEKIDMTTPDASITNSTSVMMSGVANDVNAIGYISLGSLNDTVKALSIDGAEASVENVENGTYGIVRPFNVVVKEDSLTPVGKDFLNYIMSADGQAVVTDNGYIAVSDEAYTSDQSQGKIVVGGSSSVSPVMEKLIEAYSAVNPNAEVELQTTDSTTGVSSTVEGTYDIGMASRDLKDDEASQGVTSTMIAQDGIAVIVNNDNAVDELTSDQVKSVFTGETTSWGDFAQ